MRIGARVFRRGATCVIGEVALAHDGSLGLAHAYVDAIADAGADAVKFQTHIAAAESTAREPWRIPFSRQDETRYDYWRRTEFSETQWRGLRQHADERGLLFLSSPFSDEAVDILQRIGVPAWKVASGEVSNAPLLRRLADTGLPILLSTGMSTIDEIDAAVAQLRGAGAPFAVFQCTSEYPCAPERVGFDLIPVFVERFGCLAGLSDHSGTVYPSLAAVTLGAAFVEVHVTMNRSMFGPDVVASVTVDELRQLTAGVRFVDRARSSMVGKDQLAEATRPLRQIFTKSIVARVPIAAGTVLQDSHLALKKPGGGLPASLLPSLIGRRISCDVAQDQALAEEMIETAANRLQGSR